MKNLATIALIIASTIATIANAGTITLNPKKEVVFNKGVCIVGEHRSISANCSFISTSILTTGIEWLDKELLLSSGLISDNQGKVLQSSNKSFAQLKKQLKQKYEKELNDFSLYIDEDRQIKEPKKWFTSMDECDECDGSNSSRFKIKFIKQESDNLIFVTYDDWCYSGGSYTCGELRREIHINLKTQKRTHLQGWVKRNSGVNDEWEELTIDELNGN